MKFDFDDFAVVARDVMCDGFKKACTPGPFTPSASLEAMFGACTIHYIYELKNRLFDDTEGKEVTVDEFDQICTDAMLEATKDAGGHLVRVGLATVIADITINIKKHYKLYNDEEEE